MNLKVPCHIIIQHVAKEFEVSYSDIVSRRRGQQIMDARRAAYAIVAEMRRDLPILTIARVFRGRDHSSVLKGIDRAKRQRARDEAFAAKWRAVTDKAYGWRPPERFEIFSKVGGVEQRAT